ncbi:hypothetical protein FAVG1_08406 [Fusarium avenaceum]|nr:hypothetical protein FAVG1_08406 [Fusarium avenaceum]
MGMVSNYHYDSKRSTAFAVALVPNFQLAPKTAQFISWEGCGVGWTLDDFERSSGSTGKAKDHRYYSMLQDSWIPDNGIELFQLFLAHLARRWLDLCDQFEEHLSRLRSEQLESHGKRPETIACLAENALHIAKLRRSLRGQEFAWVSVNEAHRSISLATSMKRLSWITFIFLPAMFAASLFGMNVDILESNPDWRWYLLFMGSVLFLTTAGWLFVKYFEVESWIEEHVGARFRAWLKKE